MRCWTIKSSSSWISPVCIFPQAVGCQCSKWWQSVGWNWPDSICWKAMALPSVRRWSALTHMILIIIVVASVCRCRRRKPNWWMMMIMKYHQVNRVSFVWKDRRWCWVTGSVPMLPMKSSKMAGYTPATSRWWMKKGSCALSIVKKTWFWFPVLTSIPTRLKMSSCSILAYRKSRLLAYLPAPVVKRWKSS